MVAGLSQLDKVSVQNPDKILNRFIDVFEDKLS